MTLLDLALIPLAVHAVGVTWFRGSLFTRVHEHLRIRVVEHSGFDEDALPEDVAVEAAPWWGVFVSRCPPLLAELLTCPLCLRRHLIIWGGLLWLAAAQHPMTAVGMQVCLQALAVLGAADLLWDLTDGFREEADDSDPTSAG